MSRKKAAVGPEAETPVIEPRLPRAVCSVLIALWGVIVGWRYFHDPGWQPLWRLLPALIPPFNTVQWGAVARALKPLFCLLWLASVGCGLGRFFLRRAALDTEEPLGMFLLGLALGWGLLGLAMLGLGLLRLWNFRFVVGGLAAATAALAISERHIFSRSLEIIGAPAEGKRDAPEPWKFWDSLWVWVFIVMAGFNLLGAFMPEIFYDALVYHLALPDLYWRHGGIVPASGNIFSGFPMLMQMLFAVALPLGGASAAHLLCWSCAVGAALLAYRLGANLLNRSAGCLAAALFYSIPLVGTLSWKSQAELGWAFFQLAALYALNVSYRRPEAARRWLALAGLLTGFAMGTKYQAWPALIVLAGATFLARPSGEDRKKKFEELAVFAGWSAFGVAPWCLKNVILYANPLYPLFQDYLSRGDGPDWRGLMHDGGLRDVASTLTTWRGFKAFLLHPWLMTFQYFHLDCLGPIPLMGLPLLLLFRCRARPLFSLWLSLAGLWAAWSLSGTNTRYFLPQAPVACVLFAVAFEGGLAPALKAVLRPGLLFLSASNLLFLLAWFTTYEAAGVVFGTQAVSEYLKSPHPSYARPPYSAIEFINGRLPPGGRVLFLGEARAFYCERDSISATVFDENPMRAWIRKSRNAGELREFFRKEGVTHLLVNRTELTAWGGMHLDLRGEAIFREFSARFLRTVFEDKSPAWGDLYHGWTVVFEVAGPGVPPQNQPRREASGP